MKRKGFTLVELLVVIVIILAIMALLLPAVERVRNHARAVICSANMGRLLYMMVGYENTADTLPYGFYATKNPPPDGFAGVKSYDRVGWWWFNYIGVSAGPTTKTSMVQCPAKRLTTLTLQADVLCGNIGVNQSICKEASGKDSEFKGRPLRRIDIKSTSRTFLSVDSGYSEITWQHASSPPPGSISKTTPIENTTYIPGLSVNSQRKLLPGQLNDAINGRHPDKTVNVGFADGSVTRTKAESLLVDANGESLSNSDIRWKPK